MDEQPSIAEMMGENEVMEKFDDDPEVLKKEKQKLEEMIQELKSKDFEEVDLEPVISEAEILLDKVEWKLDLIED